MIKQALTVVSLGFLLGCGGKETEGLRSKVDSLKMELETTRQMAHTLQEVSVLMDSIDANRHLLRVNMVEGTTYDDYSARMKDINNYVRDTERKIEDMERAQKRSKGAARAFSATIKKLKQEIETKNSEIAALQEQVETYRNENQNLIQVVALQEAELLDKEQEIITKQQELALIEARIQELMIQSKVSEADAYYMRAMAVEEAANRTRLAPRKKKETLKEALDLYKKALSLGHSGAQAKITALEEELD